MAVSVSSSILLKNTQPDFTRQQYDTLAAMKSANESQLPDLYIAYCLEDRAGYLFNRQNDVDPVTGKWRKCIVQNFASTMPTPTSKYAGFFIQYTGETTQDYTKGYFYGLTTGTGDITTIATMKALIDGQSTTVTLDYYGEISVVKCFENSGTDYFVYEDVIYSGVPNAGTIEFDPEEATSYETDEAIAALGIVGTVYGWENIPVGSGGSTDDKLSWGDTFPQNPSDGDPFLYMGADTFTYDEVTPVGDENPQELGWYVSDGSGGYELTTDTSVQSGTTYYEKNAQYVCGTIYQYDETNTEWVPKSAAGDVASIPVADVEAMFD